MNQEQYAVPEARVLAVASPETYTGTELLQLQPGILVMLAPVHVLADRRPVWGRVTGHAADHRDRRWWTGVEMVPGHKLPFGATFGRLTCALAPDTSDWFRIEGLDGCWVVHRSIPHLVKPQAPP